MKLLRSELKSEFNKRLFDMSARELPDRGTIFYDDHITCELSAKIVQFGFQLSGVIKATTKYECVRCLCNNLKDVTLPIKLWLSAKEILTGDDDQEMVHFPKNIDHIEISDTIADIIRLAEPMHPNCNDNCKGLCPKCGINMNQSSCDCRVDSHDSPWNVLNNF
ncbi:MAG: YceD family protein [Fidelibacterota bacterium]|jgi:uncharacterized protein|tara:strand:- start:1631 stop:2122 length:492 start_codon:yes stop_codon:yes gene_type:complete